MNRSEIEWCDYSNNPISGCTKLCRGECGRIYCFAYYMAQRQKGRNGYDPDEPFYPTLHFNMLTRPDRVKKPQKIFSVSMGDFFDPNVPDVWRYLTLNAMRYNPQHTFIMLTKQLRQMAAYFKNNSHHTVPDNLWLGISQDGVNTDHRDIELFGMLDFIPRKFISFEPLLGEIKDMNLNGLEWVIIGSQTGSKKKQPKDSWVRDIFNAATELKIPIFLKNNLGEGLLQQWPASMVN